MSGSPSAAPGPAVALEHLLEMQILFTSTHSKSLGWASSATATDPCLVFTLLWSSISQQWGWLHSEQKVTNVIIYVTIKSAVASSVCFLSRIPCSREASCHVRRMLKQPYGWFHMLGNWGLWPTATLQVSRLECRLASPGKSKQLGCDLMRHWAESCSPSAPRWLTHRNCAR